MNSILWNFRCLEIRIEIKFFMVGLVYQIGHVGMGCFNSQTIGVNIYMVNDCYFANFCFCFGFICTIFWEFEKGWMAGNYDNRIE